jgi:Flp pilus assembly CpaE family ATPase
MDENIWPQLVSKKFGLDVLHAGRVNPNLRIEPAQIQSMMNFIRRNYEALVFDVSGNLERYSLEAMQESKRVFLVCTPEIPSLHLAREKMGFLKTVGLDQRVSILLNRISKKPLFTPPQVEELVGAKVLYSFSNDYFAVSRATTGGECLDPESVIGKQCTEFASMLMERRPPEGTPERRKKFLEFFNVTAPQMASSEK